MNTLGQVPHRLLHDELADTIMDRVGYSEIPEVLRELHSELSRRFDLMFAESRAESEQKEKLYYGIRDCFSVPTPCNTKMY